MIRLETERLILRNFTHGDIEDACAIFSCAEVARYEDFDPMTRAEVAEMLGEWQAMDNRMAVVLKTTGRVIGCAGYWTDEDGDNSLDYDFHPAFGGQGYATEAAAEVMRHLFEDKHVPKLFADCDVRNDRSWRLMERLGMRRVERMDNESYKDDAEGKPILISIYLYRKDNAE